MHARLAVTSPMATLPGRLLEAYFGQALQLSRASVSWDVKASVSVLAGVGPLCSPGGS